MSEPEAPYKTQSESPMKRYFLISGNNSHGDTFDITLISQGVFPSRKAISDRFKDQTTYSLIGIISIFEFKSEKDYNEFIAE